MLKIAYKVWVLTNIDLLYELKDNWSIYFYCIKIWN